MSVFKRSAVVATSLVFAGVLSACSGGGASNGDGGQPTGESPASNGSKISNPKDAAAVERCNLLPAEAATSLGLGSQGEERPDPLDPEAPSPCNWQDQAGTAVSLTPLDGRSIQSYYDNKSKYVDFQEVTVAGHPAVRANEGDPMQDGFCNIFLATKDGQVLAAQSDLSSDRVGKEDPCGIAQKALEASVPTLPAAK